MELKLVEMIEAEIEKSPNVSYDSIIGLKFAKNTLFEIIVWPVLRPDLFKGAKNPSRVFAIP